MRLTFIASVLVPLYLVTLLSCRGSNRAFSVEEDTVALWNFRGDQGAVVQDEGPLRLDLIPARDNTLTWTRGKFGSALHFPDKCMLGVANPQPLKFQKEITIEIWFKIDKKDEGKQMGLVENIAWPNSGFRMELDASGNINWMVEAAGREAILTSKAQILSDVWNYVAATYDGAKMKIYINGAPDSQQDEKNGVLTTPKPELYIGYFEQHDPVYFIGDINAIRISNTARSAFPMPAEPSSN